jgi:cytochrome c oxidase assembly factor CtaG
MSPILDAALRSWRLAPGPALALSLAAAIYWRGWLRLHRRLPAQFPPARLLSFFCGLGMIVIALESPLDELADLLLTAHMIQHLLLLMVAPPLILYGNPFLPLLRGLPQSAMKEAVRPIISWKPLKRIGRTITNPMFCWAAYVASTVAWHVPAAFDAALRWPALHLIEHSCFLGTGLAFWWPVILPWPARPQWPRLAMIPYLFLADIQNTALSAYMIFCDHVLYSTYAGAIRLPGLTPLEDQITAGAIMWVPGSVVFLAPVILISVQAVGGQRRAVRPSSLRVFPIEPSQA